jgi:beta-glucosidase
MHDHSTLGHRLALVSGITVLNALTSSCRAGADAPTEAPASLAAWDEQADELLGRMTLAEKVGQMTQVDQEFLEDPADIERFFLGSLLSGGNSDPSDGNDLESWTNLYDRLQARTRSARLGIPLLYGIDAVHGHSNVLGAVVFPHNIGLGATRNAELVRRIGEITAREMRATGLQWNFAPCVCVPRDERWGRSYEGFSEDPELVAELGAAAVRGLQGADLSGALAVLATAKHFAADGGTAMGTGAGGGQGLDQGDARMDEETLRRLHIRPYQEAIAAGVGSIMPSYSSWNGVKMSGSRYLLTDVLKGELGFEGFLISDYRAVNQLDPDYKVAIETSINAGMDMVMVPDTYEEFIRHLTDLVEEGRVPMARIDDAVRRILRVKLAMGLLDPDRSHSADRALHASFGSAEHREVARQAVRESVVLLRNEGGTLPLDKQAARIHVAGKSADNLGFQTGGWTIDWQGGSGDVTSGGTTVLAAMRRAVSPGTAVTFTQDGSGAEGADVGVVVIGERPYAEGNGDRGELSLDDEDRAAVAAVRAAGIPVVVVVVSGRPLILGEVLEQSDALLAAWLPGTEGDGVADVLFGDYEPSGRLSFTWPRSVDQLPLNVGDADYDPLFAFGHGLGY